ncbi:MAG TPA: sigma 54-interacting transcriptional regulator, partial [Candidatus Acidoferrum sp.]|nr:sigma 54-interacting transcriptional regulator [Candidatus Acidoferrum sp.]
KARDRVPRIAPPRKLKFMNSGPQLALATDAERYVAVFRIFEALSACGEPEGLARVLADQLRDLISFDYLDALIFKEDSNEIEWQGWGTEPIALPDLPVEETSSWHVFRTQEPLHVADWSTDDTFPRAKRLLENAGVRLGSVIRVPLTTAHRRLGTLGIASRDRNTYRSEDVCFLQLLSRGIALAIDDVLNLRKSRAARLELERQNTRLKLLLDMTNRITSNLDLTDLLRAISGSVRQVMECDLVAISLVDSESGQFRICALDFPNSNGFVREELVTSLDPVSGRAFETLKPVIMNQFDPGEFGPEGSQIVIGEGLKTLCIAPLVNRGRAIGVLCLGRKEDNSFSEHDAEFLGEVAGQVAIAIENALAYHEISELKDKLAQEKLYLEEEIRSELNFEHIIGNSPALNQVLDLVETVASSDSTVLLLGETGTGKELIARAIHDHSQRKDRTFVKLNCAAIPTGLLESELFGHEKGAFTGAISQKIGRLELAHQGTLFLDEVGDIPLEIQPKLLRALQEREFERLGSTQTRKVSVRLVAATNRDLEQMIAAREFRSDLYYRINVFPIRVPPLRERREDIPLLVRFFVQKLAVRMQKQIETIPAAAMKTLTNWDWPGNIRELENFVERAVILTRGKSLEVPIAELLKSRVDFSVPNNNGSQDEISRILREMISEINKGTARGAAKEHDETERQQIMRVLRETKGRVGGADGAAVRMAINRTTLISRIKKLGINPRLFF